MIGFFTRPDPIVLRIADIMLRSWRNQVTTIAFPSQYPVYRYPTSVTRFVSAKLFPRLCSANRVVMIMPATGFNQDYTTRLPNTSENFSKSHTISFYPSTPFHSVLYFCALFLHTRIHCGKGLIEPQQRGGHDETTSKAIDAQSGADALQIWLNDR